MQAIAEFDPKDFENPNATTGVYAKFYHHAEQDEAASLEEGRPVFRDVEFIEIMTAGDAKDIRRRPVRPVDKQRFQAAYRMFREGNVEQVVGTPLTEVPWISSAMREELQYSKVRTVEQLAELNDQACGRMPGMYDMKRKAAAWLKKSNDAAPFAALHKENEDLKARLEALESSMTTKEPKAKKAAIE